MPERTLRFKKIDSFAGFQRDILSKLNIKHTRLNSLPEFEENLRTYVERNPTQILNLRVDMDTVKFNIKQRVIGAIRKSIDFPPGFEFGQPHMMWGVEPDPRPLQEVKDEAASIESAYQSELLAFQNGLESILKAGGGRFSVITKQV